MKTIVDGKEERVCYIEYSDNIPHQVFTAVWSPDCVTGPCWILMNHWDFFANNGDKTDLRHYNSGGGGSASEIQAPHWVDGYTGEYWIDHEIAAFKGEPINAKELKKPLRLNGFSGSSINPFKVSEETYSHEYCEVCGKEGTEICWEHVYEDENDNYELKYIETNQPY